MENNLLGEAIQRVLNANVLPNTLSKSWGKTHYAVFPV